ncbi:MAG: hypothetical protein ABSB70_20040 [Candidatus Velthaea sp.]
MPAANNDKLIILSAAERALQYWRPRIANLTDLTQRANVLMQQSPTFPDNRYGAGWAVVDYFACFQDALVKYRQLQSLMQQTSNASPETIAQIASVTNDLNADAKQVAAAVDNLKTPADGFGPQCVNPLDSRGIQEPSPSVSPMCGTVLGSIPVQTDPDDDNSNLPVQMRLAAENHQLGSAERRFSDAVAAIASQPTQFAPGSLADAVDRVLQEILAAQQYNFQIQMSILNIKRNYNELQLLNGFQAALNRERAADSSLVAMPAYKAAVVLYRATAIQSSPRWSRQRATQSTTVRSPFTPTTSTSTKSAIAPAPLHTTSGRKLVSDPQSPSLAHATVAPTPVPGSPVHPPIPQATRVERSTPEPQPTRVERSTPEPQATRVERATPEPQPTRVEQSSPEPQSTPVERSTPEPQATRVERSTPEPQSTPVERSTPVEWPAPRATRTP